MPRTKRRTVKRSLADSTVNQTVNATMANQPKNIKEILVEFESESNTLKLLNYLNHFSC